MSFRSIILGFILGLSVSIFSYFNDQVIRQTYLIGSHLPIFIFGIVVILILLINPILRRFGPGAPLKPLELAVCTAIGLAACGWPGSSFFRYFSDVIALPAHTYNSKANWKSANVMSYVPGGSPLLGEGHIRDINALAKSIGASSKDEGEAKSINRCLWDALSFDGKTVIQKAMETGAVPQEERARLVEEINTCLQNPHTFPDAVLSSINLPTPGKQLLSKKNASALSEREIQKLNRIIIETAFPQNIIPSPRGGGYLLEEGDGNSPAVTNLMQGAGPGKKVGLLSIPWKSWKPAILLWGLLAIFLGLASLCMVVIVQPQWKKELLPYPIARFIMDLTEPSEKGLLPKVAESKLFWYGIAAVSAIHLINGLQKWFPNFIQIPLVFNFESIYGLGGYFKALAETCSWSSVTPWLFLSVIAFTFFLNTQVSFSVGISPYVYALLYFLLTANGITVSNSWTEPQNIPMMRFGAYLGFFVMIIYMGRRYYGNVVTSAFGMRRHDETPAAAAWAFRIFLVCAAGMVAVLSMNGLDWQLALIFVFIGLVMFLMITRVNAETGIFLNQPYFIPVAVIMMFFGINGLGPTSYIILLLASVMLIQDSREWVMPFVANGMYMATDKNQPLAGKRSIFSIGTMIVLGFAAALIATLFMQYNHGLNFGDSWAIFIGTMPYDQLATNISKLSAYNTLAQSFGVGGFARFTAAQPMWNILGWAGTGLFLVMACSLLRTKFVWWPIHPVLFLVWGTWYPSAGLGLSILIGWAIKAGVMKFSGAKGYHTVKPFMIGIISGELLMGIFWIIVGIIYYVVTGQIPQRYSPFPV